MHEITLDEKHIYRVDGIITPGVHEILEATGLVKPYLGDPWYGGRGTAIHTACELLERDDLDESLVNPEIAGFVDAYRLFLADAPLKGWTNVEVRLFDPIYQFCGTPDRFLPLCDIKSGDMETLQLAAYGQLLRVNGFYPGREAFFVKLLENGKYKLYPYKFNTGDTNIFLSACQIYHERIRRKLL